MVKIYILMIMALAMLISSCQKEDYNLPADVMLNFSVSSPEAIGGKLVFNSTVIKVENFRFTGNRILGEDIDFIKQMNPVAEYNLFSESIPVITVNIPRGLYEQFEIQLDIASGAGDYGSINTQIENWLRKIEDDDDSDDDDDDDGDDDSDDDDSDEDDSDEDSDDIDDDEPGDDIYELQVELGTIINLYLNSTEPGAVFRGTFSDNGIDYDIVFVMEDPVNLSFPALNSQKGREITFNEGNNNLEITFNPANWLLPVSEQVLKNSWIGINQDQHTIFIHKKINPELYIILLSRLEDSFTVTKTD